MRPILALDQSLCEAQPLNKLMYLSGNLRCGRRAMEKGGDGGGTGDRQGIQAGRSDLRKISDCGKLRVDRRSPATPLSASSITLVGRPASVADRVADAVGSSLDSP